MFYYKMKGDYHRYLAEFATGNDRKEAAENSLVAYKAASDIAMTELPPTHPIRYVMSSTRSSKILLNQSLVPCTPGNEAVLSKSLLKSQRLV